MKNLKQTVNVILVSSLFSVISCQKEPSQQIDSKEDGIINYAGSTLGYQDGPVLNAQFTYPNLITKGPGNSLYIVEYSNFQRPGGSHGAIPLGGNRIRKINPESEVSTIIDLGSISEADRIHRILGIAVNKAGDIFFSQGNQIKRIYSGGGQVSVAAGDGSSEIMRDGPALTSTFWQPTGLAFDKNDCLYIMDTRNNAVRLLSNGKVSTLAGGNREFDPTIEPGYWGPRDGTGRRAEFDYPNQISVDDSLNVYVVGGYHRIIRKMSKSGEVITVPPGTSEYDTDNLATYVGVSPPYKNSLYVTGIFHDSVGLDWSYSLERFSLKNGQRSTLAADFFNAAEYDQFPNKPLPVDLRAFSGVTIAGNSLYICNPVNHQILKMYLD